MEVTFNTVSNTTSTLVKLTNNYGILTPDDVTYASIVLRKISAIPAVLPEVFREFVSPC